MTANDLQRELEEMQELFAANGLVLDTRPVVVERTTRGNLRVTWRSAKAGAELFRAQFASLDDYVGWVNAGAYTVLLFDGAFLQFSYDFHQDRLAAHRLAYYPNPFDMDLVELQQRPLLDVLDEYRQDWTRGLRLRSPLRFDFDPLAVNDGHPATHLTLNSADCRWAMVSPMSPGQFLRFVFRHFYPSLWNQMEFIRTWRQEYHPRTITLIEESALHVSWRRS